MGDRSFLCFASETVEMARGDTDTAVFGDGRGDLCELCELSLTR